MKSQKTKLIAGGVLILLLSGSVIFLNQKGNKPAKEPNFYPAQTETQTPTPTSKNKSPAIVSTKPDPLEEAIISANEIVEITFNQPLQNDPEFRRRFDPLIDYKLQISSDRKTVKFIPSKPFELGITYTLFILPDTKFEGGGKLEGEKTYHFSTIKYRGV